MALIYSPDGSLLNPQLHLFHGSISATVKITTGSLELLASPTALRYNFQDLPKHISAIVVTCDLPIRTRVTTDGDQGLVEPILTPLNHQQNVRSRGRLPNDKSHFWCLCLLLY